MFRMFQDESDRGNALVMIDKLLFLAEDMQCNAIHCCPHPHHPRRPRMHSHSPAPSQYACAYTYARTLTFLSLLLSSLCARCALAVFSLPLRSSAGGGAMAACARLTVRCWLFWAAADCPALIKAAKEKDDELRKLKLTQQAQDNLIDQLRSTVPGSVFRPGARMFTHIVYCKTKKGHFFF